MKKSQFGKIPKFNSTNIKLCIVAGPPLEYIHVRLCTVPVPQDSCILPRERDIPLSPGTNIVSLMRHTLWEADCGREAAMSFGDVCRSSCVCMLTYACINTCTEAVT